MARSPRASGDLFGFDPPPEAERRATDWAAGDEYRTVTACFRGLAPSGLAFFVDDPRGGRHLSIARQLIHAADDDRLHGLFNGEQITFRLRAWKAEALGFA